MNPRPTTTLRAVLLAVPPLLAGCNLSQPYPAKEFHALDVRPPARASATPGGGTLRVQPVRMVEPYGGTMLHYRVGSTRFEADYYANFVDEPGRILTAEVIEWLAGTGDFEAVVAASSPVGAERDLKLVVQELYCDTRNGRTAVVAARAFLLDTSGVDGRVLMTRDYRETETIGADGTDAVVEAWGVALARMLDRLATDIRAVPEPSDA